MAKRIEYRNSNTGYIVLILAAVFAFFAIGAVKNLLEKLGLMKTADEREFDKINEQGRIDILKGSADSIKELYKVQPATKSDAEWQQIAETIYNSLRIRVEQDDEKAGFELCRVKNDSDVFKLIQAFGNRSIYFMGFPYKSMTLPQFVNDQLSSEKVKAINSNYARKNIKFRY